MSLLKNLDMTVATPEGAWDVNGAVEGDEVVFIARHRALNNVSFAYPRDRLDGLGVFRVRGLVKRGIERGVGAEVGIGSAW